MQFFDYSEGDFIPSELSGLQAVDIHHIRCKGMGGSKEMDYIENLMALTRAEHEKYGDKKQYIDFLKQAHYNFIKLHRSDYEIPEIPEDA
jgi:hypothetical protein